MKRVKKNYKEYNVYRTMVYSCYPSKNRSTYYELNNIGVCEEWLGPEGFWNFLKDMGEMPSKNYRLRRKNTFKDFTPENCEWSKKKSKNYRNRIIINYNGESKSLKNWCQELGLSYQVCYVRYKKGKTPEEIFSKRNSISIEYKGTKYSIKGISQKYNLKIGTVYYRYYSGWKHSDIIETPVNEIPISLRTEENMKYGRYSYFLEPYFKEGK